ncbi:MAG: 2-oxoacid:ferredoxin oxidoreductase subunit beta [Nitrospirae bacterium]|nr:2-oxoacid:ferredoxin oxidoreductase subunit beta [Nitrospirota bacterium]
MALPATINIHVDEPLKAKDYRSDITPTWCPGCGDFGVVGALAKAYADQKYNPNAVTTVSGIGCSSRLPLWMNSFGIHSCHGRAVPVAVGAHLARPEMPVVVTIGDGDCFSIGAGHIGPPARRNMNITVIVMDNGTFALTKNQNSPLSRTGLPGTLASGLGNLDSPLNPIELMITYGATFVAQTYSANAKHMGATLNAALSHQGFSYVNVLSPCPTYNKVDTFAYFRPRIHDINESGEHTDTGNRAAALAKAAELYNHHHSDTAPVPVGVYYQVQKPVYMENVRKVQQYYKATSNPDWNAILDWFKP